MTTGAEGIHGSSGVSFWQKAEQNEAPKETKWSPFGAWDDAKKLEAAASMQAGAYQG